MSVPVLTVEQMREWERDTWSSGQTEEAVIARVGAVIARRIREIFPEETRILILAGKGNNGNDARQACPHLGDFEVELLEVTDPAKQLSNLKQSLAQQPDLIVDALFGIGLNRPFDRNWCRFIRSVNESDAFVLSVDSPSGLNCQTGLAEGDAITADMTLTLGAPKVGLLDRTAWPYVGRLEVAPEIGLIERDFDTVTRWSAPEDFAGVVQRRRADSHKGTFGHLVIFAGSMGYHGAAVLAARAASSALPGLVTVVTTPEAYQLVASQLQSCMVHPWSSKWKLPEKASAVLFGPGLAGPDVSSSLRRRIISIWKEFECPVIADASALEWLPAKGDKLPGPRVVTPHPGEAARMLKKTTHAVQDKRVNVVRRISKKLGGALVVLKGHQSIVGTSKHSLFYNCSGSPRLAQGGSGDVLAGFLGGSLAQPALREDPLLTTRYAVWRHGLAGESEAWNGWVDELPRELSRPV